MRTLLLSILILSSCKYVPEGKYSPDELPLPDDDNIVVSQNCTYPLNAAQSEIDASIYGPMGYKVAQNRDSTFQKWFLDGSGLYETFLAAPTGTDFADPMNSAPLITKPSGNFAFEFVFKNMSKGAIPGGDPSVPQAFVAVGLTNTFFEQPAVFLSGIQIKEDGTLAHVRADPSGAHIETSGIAGNPRLRFFYNASDKTMTYYVDGNLIATDPLDLSTVTELISVLTGNETPASTGSMEFDLILDKSEMTGTYPAGTTDICGNTL